MDILKFALRKITQLLNTGTNTKGVMHQIRIQEWSLEENIYQLVKAHIKMLGTWTMSYKSYKKQS